ncbi:anhydro-N-acetylmuramic acid kinase [Riemerella anatipestifer]|uniref:anhydro-N-acetylmuramic acid kinase n=1 Tax=Riemerella anatipestifer TaxID=34085 RepID=UPI00137538C8|nr:anhydro-N-acetylmuramic acid kinase [Riemerella anatipestifer]
MYIIGVMSGTSLDGIDFCYFKIDESTYDFEIIKAQTYPYPKEWQMKLKLAAQQTKQEVALLNAEYSNYLNREILKFIKTENIENLDLIASHGHTVWHNPKSGFTLQIGNLPTVSKEINVPIVGDFRVQDVRLGGQGAPLVPMGDALLFSDYDFCLNLGGFSNISYKRNGERLAFDICPVNTLLNYYSEKYFSLPYDKNGEIARSGKIYQSLVDKLNALPFYKQSHPKSLGIEQVNEWFIPIIETFSLEPKDLLASLVEHMAVQIANVLDTNIGKRLLVTGGGAYNQYLIEKLSFLASHIEIIIPPSEVVEYKEALIFGLLGLLKWQDKTNVLASVTGAKHNHSSGVLFLNGTLL